MTEIACMNTREPKRFAEMSEEMLCKTVPGLPEEVIKGLTKGSYRKTSKVDPNINRLIKYLDNLEDTCDKEWIF